MTGLVLLTGATGFVGRHVLRQLLNCRIKVRLVVREGSNSEFDSVENIERVHTTTDLFLESADWWMDKCVDVDTIIHLAWYAEPGKYLHSKRNFDCIAGTMNLAKAAAGQKVRRFIGIGTCFEYDLTGGRLSTTTRLLPLSPYAAAKAAVFFALSQLLPTNGVEFAWCRLFYLYGEGEDDRRLVPYIRSMLSAGMPVKLTLGYQVRDYLDIKDAAKLIVNTAMSNLIGPVNICSGYGITVRQMAEKIADESGQRELLKFGERPENYTDPPCVIGVK